MKSIFIIITILISFIQFDAFAQPALTFDLKKPPKFENRTLGSEKTGNKKFTIPRRFTQNTFTHYNYYFNANNRLNEVIARAKAAHRDDFTKLLPFYNYSVQATSVYKTDLDSVIYKSTTGVLIHDLRNDWIDNLYLLIGKAYYLRNDLDSAYLTFQYVNYAFSPKEKDGYDKVIGSNEDVKSNAFSISTKENSNIVKKAFSRPPSRNESLVWQIKTYLAKDEQAEAAGLIETLKNDPLFPARLEADLLEVQALWYYNQQAYDSAAFYLEQVVNNAADKQEQARWEYLIAQLHERSNNAELARKFYEKAIKHTVDPVMEVYAMLNAIRQNKEDEQSIQRAIDELLKMARKDRYLQYRDIIYYTAALIELERTNPDGARLLLLRSVQSSINNPVQKSLSFLTLGDLTFKQKKYSESKNFYDSVDIKTIPPPDYKSFANRQAALQKIVLQTGVLYRQDSLMRIASMPAEEREAFIKNLLKQLRKSQGVKDEGEGVIDNSMMNNNAAASDLFGNLSGKGDWYFYNPALKSKGFNEFKVKWGNRPNTDNWRRFSAIAQPMIAQGQPSNALNSGAAGAVGVPLILSYEAMLDRVPLTPEKVKASNDSSDNALFGLGQAYMDGLEDYRSAIETFEELLTDYPTTTHAEEAWFRLYYCYRKTGDTDRMAKIRQALMSKFPNGKFTSLISNPNQVQSPDSVLKSKATKRYEDIYNLFIEGKFKDATTQKKQADSIYGQNFWTPQLLYIEAVYYIRQRADSTAKQILGKILQLYPASPMHPKTANLLAVLNRRKQIEEYLTNLDIERPFEEKEVASYDVPKTQNVVVPPKKEVAVTAKPDSALPAARPTEIPETKKAPEAVVAEHQPGREANASAIKGDNSTTTKPRVNIDVPRRGPDSLRMTTPPVAANAVYTNEPSKPHYVVLILDKVDPVYVTEARNAFNRYHRERYSDKKIEAIPLALTDEVKLILMKNFENASAALDYIRKTKVLTQSEIIPWLTAGKYSFVMITETNLELLKTKKDISIYRKFMEEAYPGL